MNAAGEAAGQLDIGGVFDRTTEIYKQCFSTVWIVALILMVPAAIIVAILGNDGLLGLVGSLVNLAASAWLIGSIVRIVEDVEVDGTVDLAVGEVLGSVWPRLIALILLEIVIAILVAFGLILLIVPGVILALMWIVAIPSMVVEGLGVFDSMGRSSQLTKGNRMRILAVGLIVLAIYLGIAIIGGLLVAAVPIVGAIALVALAVILYPYVSIITSVLFFRLRDLHAGPGDPLVAEAPLA